MDCAVRFFVRLYKNFAGLLSQVKEFLCSMTETYSSKACALTVRYCLKNNRFDQSDMLESFIIIIDCCLFGESQNALTVAIASAASKNEMLLFESR